MNTVDRIQTVRAVDRGERSPSRGRIDQPDDIYPGLSDEGCYKQCCLQRKFAAKNADCTADKRKRKKPRCLQRNGTKAPESNAEAVLGISTKPDLTINKHTKTANPGFDPGFAVFLLDFDR